MPHLRPAARPKANQPTHTIAGSWREAAVGQRVSWHHHLVLDSQPRRLRFGPLPPGEMHAEIVKHFSNLPATPEAPLGYFGLAHLVFSDTRKEFQGHHSARHPRLRSAYTHCDASASSLLVLTPRPSECKKWKEVAFFKARCGIAIGFGVCVGKPSLPLKARWVAFERVWPATDPDQIHDQGTASTLRQNSCCK